MKNITPRFFMSIALTITAGLASAATAYVSSTSGQISLAPKDNLLIATTIVNWDPKASDQLVVNWIAPPQSFCRNSSFSVARGINTSHAVSWSYRTVIHQTTTCIGKWTVKLVNATNNQILASAGYTILS